jgi:hypothetical protein
MESTLHSRSLNFTSALKNVLLNLFKAPAMHTMRSKRKQIGAGTANYRLRRP